MMRILATIAQPTSGRVMWNGNAITQHTEALRCVLGYLPQDFGVLVCGSRIAALAGAFFLPSLALALDVRTGTGWTLRGFAHRALARRPDEPLASTSPPRPAALMLTITPWCISRSAPLSWSPPSPAARLGFARIDLPSPMATSAPAQAAVHFSDFR
jgi:hypothetical protein